MSAYSEKGDLQSKTGLDIFLVIGNQDVQQEDNQEGNHQRAAQEVLCQLGQELQNLGLGFDTNADSQDPELGCAEGTGCGGTCTAANIVNGSLIQRKADTQNHGAAGMMDCEEDAVEFASTCVRRINTEQTVSLTDIAYKAQVNNTTPAEATQTHTSPVSPPPYMVGMVEIELDKLTGKVDILDYMAVVDCGIPINPALATIQTEGGIVQGIGHTLMENVTYDWSGRPAESSFMQYKVPTRLDMGRLKVEFEHSYEPTGPFGAKSIGEIVINTPGPAIAHAIYRATGKWFRELPITPEQIAMALAEE